ncbi:hypothetical protein HYH03_010948 [Edaphochlamys debaryana]|uniref:Alpha-type protein kinase domain-containing protein n=1 Tax=Edaphochlamys debaryana TaxID=47281 RepID=A0A836BWW6_9CHLO|nr:hypothetical protein HYH03_010948 [Edaphochlamys debaryana]|eukprot:KAG2490554.1 hypothetical protein HYH03_010948 [Edaphochlamys debaryana]
MAAPNATELSQLEQQLAGLYAQIAQQHGLPAAMQALGRLMMGPVPVAVPPPAPAPAPTPAAAPATAPAPAATPVAATTPGPSAPPPPSLTRTAAPSPFSASHADAQPPSGGAGGSGSGGGAAAAAGPSAASSPPLGGLPFTSPSLESIHPVPSATLSQLPSGVLSLVSPSAAGGSEAGGSDADDEAPDGAAARRGPAAAAAAVAAAAVAAAADGAGQAQAHGHGRTTSDLDVTALTRAAVSAAAATAAAGGGGGPGLRGDRSRAVDVPRAAAEAVARAGLDVEGAAAGLGGGEAESPKSQSSFSLKNGPGTPRSGSLWLRAVNAAKGVVDPWSGRSLHLLPMERAVRQRYNAMTGAWVTDEVLVKMESKPFAAGAMRECFAAKKLSTFTHNTDWMKASNMVAKRYKKEGVRKSVYYNDVLVQMDAKMLGEMYNKTDPPKQVDVMQCAILQLPSRPGAPLYAIEQLIEGDYVKYNSNSGFVKGDDVLRNTPQAFSHFTWVLTKGLKICVDVQGVGDLYTDPQLHTLDGEGYGEGNLGARGMGLFFRSHECNALCARLGLKPFDRCDADVRAQGYSSEVSSASASATRPGARPGATAARTLAKSASYKARIADKRRRQELLAPGASEEVLLSALSTVPKESPEALVHLEIAKLYGEVVLLPELKPNEDPEDALRGGLFHLGAAAQGGALLALAVLARAHAGMDPTAPQFSQMFKVGAKQKEFRPHVAVAWRCVGLMAERGVRGAALAAAAAHGSGGGLFGEEVLDGRTDPAKAARLYAAALALPDLLAEGEEEGEGSDGVIHEGVEEEGPDGEEEDGDPVGVFGADAESGRSEASSPQFDMSIMRDTPPAARGRGGLDEAHISALSELDLASNDPTRLAALAGLRVPKIDELKPSRAFLARLKRLVEEEAAALPGAATPKYEVLYKYGSLLLSGGEGLAPDPKRAAELLEQAAEEAEGAGKGKLAQRYYEAAARAQALCEEEDEGEA